MKKLPLIGLLIGAIAAMFAMRKKKAEPQEEEASSTGDSTSA
jgi:hypothetical protein